MSDLQARAKAPEVMIGKPGDLFFGMPLPAVNAPTEALVTARPSRLIEMALVDLEALERDPNYVIDMSDWHVPTLWRASVCLAGVCMVRRLGAARGRDYQPEDFGDSEGALYGLYYFITGDLEGAFSYLDLLPPEYFGLPSEVAIADYHYNASQFKSDMRGLADTLRQAGI